MTVELALSDDRDLTSVQVEVASAKPEDLASTQTDEGSEEGDAPQPLREVLDEVVDLGDGRDGALVCWLDAGALARAIEATERPDGLAIWQNNGVPADQTIAHVHFHVAGTLPSGGTERGEVDEVSLAETDEIGHRLRLALGEQTGD